jgi:hypothetical protein
MIAFERVRGCAHVLGGRAPEVKDLRSKFWKIKWHLAEIQKAIVKSIGQGGK